MNRQFLPLLLLGACLIISNAASAEKSGCHRFWQDTTNRSVEADRISQPADTIPVVTRELTEEEMEEARDTIVYYNINPASFRFQSDSVDHRLIRTVPNFTVQQMVKGAASGLYVQETTGEPGSVHQYMYIRGVNRPLLNPEALYLSQPAVYVNGIPLIQDNPYIYKIQAYDLNPVGPATNLLSILDEDNIEKIEIVKDFKDLGVLGPRAANGAVYITTRNAQPGRKMLSINSYLGYGFSPMVNTLNAASEKNFRLPFYSKYGTGTEVLPGYLSDSSNTDYYGPSNWTDLYYKNVPLYNINGSLTGGSGRSNFRAFFGTTHNAATADETAIKRYNGSFYISMVPATWLSVSSMISGTILKRSRNRSFTERFTEMRYLPSLANPLPPNKNIYQQFTDIYDDILIDDNLNTSVQGYFSLSANIGRVVNTARLSFDYNEGKRDVFYPKIMFSGNNYVSNYYGFNQRFILEDKLEYSHLFDNQSRFDLQGGLAYQGDLSRYNYLVGYNGPDDVKRIPEVEGNKSYASYLKSEGYLVNGFIDKVQQRLMSFWGSARYELLNGLQIGALLRSDGSSSVQPDHRWFISPVLDLKYDLIRKGAGALSSMNLHASWGKIGDLLADGLTGEGPQYRPQLSWGGFPLASYNGFGTYSRPYNDAWIGYDIPWSYTEQINIGTSLDMFDRLVTLQVDVYNKDNKDLTITVPTTAESGYQYELQPGMWINNKGVDLTVELHLPARENGLGWTASLNGSYNKNTLKELPGGATEMIIGNQKLELGKPVDGFWLLQNTGIYSNDSELPSGQTYKGLPLKSGDPRWTDVDGNNIIDDADRVVKGNYMPRVYGGFFNSVSYKGFDLNFHLQFALGQYLMNQEAASYMDFINRDRSNSVDGIKEVTFWEDRVQTTRYPMYNPWSEVNAYQLNQDLFLEKASYLALRSVSLGYKIYGKNQEGFGLGRGFRDIYLYVTGTNLIKFSPYSNRDPELGNYYGYDTGLSLPLTRSVVLGLKLNL